MFDIGFVPRLYSTVLVELLLISVLIFFMGLYWDYGPFLAWDETARIAYVTILWDNGLFVEDSQKSIPSFRFSIAFASVLFSLSNGSFVLFPISYMTECGTMLSVSYILIINYIFRILHA